MLKNREIVLVALAVSAFWVVILVLQSDATAYGEICEYTQSGQKECSTYHVIMIALLKTARFLNDISAAITALATIAIAVFTYTLYTASTEQAQLTRDTLKLARDEFNATHRPKIIVHSAEFIHIENRFGASILCFNIGENSAQNIEARGVIIATKPAGNIQRPLVKELCELASGMAFYFEIDCGQWNTDSIGSRNLMGFPF